MTSIASLRSCYVFFFFLLLLLAAAFDPPSLVKWSSFVSRSHLLETETGSNNGSTIVKRSRETTIPNTKVRTDLWTQERLGRPPRGRWTRTATIKQKGPWHKNLSKKKLSGLDWVKREEACDYYQKASTQPQSSLPQMKVVRRITCGLWKIH